MAENTFMYAQNLHKIYRKNAISTPVLKGVDMEVAEGEFLSVVGASGSGKSTLMHLLGSLDKPDAGEIYYRGKRIDNLSADKRDHLRNHDFGFIFQFYHLLPELTALENVMIPLMIRSSVFSWLGNGSAARKRATTLMEKVGLGHRMHHLPKELSGGEMQRTAIARALIGNPALLFADEPTGNLDEDTGREIVQLLRELNEIDNVTIIMVTHNLEIARGTHRIIKLVAGHVDVPLQQQPEAFGVVRPESFDNLQEDENHPDNTRRQAGI